MAVNDPTTKKQSSRLLASGGLEAEVVAKGFRLTDIHHLTYDHAALFRGKAGFDQNRGLICFVDDASGGFDRCDKSLLLRAKTVCAIAAVAAKKMAAQIGPRKQIRTDPGTGFDMT